MRIGTAVDKVISAYEEAKRNPNVMKPIAYALYHTWRYVDTVEKPRKIEENDDD